MLLWQDFAIGIKPAPPTRKPESSFCSLFSFGFWSLFGSCRSPAKVKNLMRIFIHRSSCCKPVLDHQSPILIRTLNNHPKRSRQSAVQNLPKAMWIKKKSNKLYFAQISESPLTPRTQIHVVFVHAATNWVKTPGGPLHVNTLSIYDDDPFLTCSQKCQQLLAVADIQTSGEDPARLIWLHVSRAKTTIFHPPNSKYN